MKLSVYIIIVLYGCSLFSQQVQKHVCALIDGRNCVRKRELGTEMCIMREWKMKYRAIEGINYARMRMNKSRCRKKLQTINCDIIR